MRGARAALPVSLALAGLGCIFPDEDIRFLDSDFNEFAVRFVESTPMSLEDRCACGVAVGATACEDIEVPEDRGLACPFSEPPRLPQLMDPDLNASFDFCGCPAGERDSKALPPIDDIYVEDLDRDDEVAKDPLFAALLLDVSNDRLGDPSDWVAYRQLLNPDATLQNENSVSALIPNADRLSRPDRLLRQVVINNPSFDSVDLCNDAGVGGGRLSEGWHTITLIVTDRPWYSLSQDPDDPDAPRVIKHGVPDVANNATWTTRQWAFHCSNVENNSDCQCAANE